MPNQKGKSRIFQDIELNNIKDLATGEWIKASQLSKNKTILQEVNSTSELEVNRDIGSGLKWIPLSEYLSYAVSNDLDNITKGDAFNQSRVINGKSTKWRLLTLETLENSFGGFLPAFFIPAKDLPPFLANIFPDGLDVTDWILEATRIDAEYVNYIIKSKRFPSTGHLVTVSKDDYLERQFYGWNFTGYTTSTDALVIESVYKDSDSTTAITGGWNNNGYRLDFNNDKNNLSSRKEVFSWDNTEEINFEFKPLYKGKALLTEDDIPNTSYTREEIDQYMLNLGLSTGNLFVNEIETQ
jgi:hypothetical protein